MAWNFLVWITKSVTSLGFTFIFLGTPKLRTKKIKKIEVCEFAGNQSGFALCRQQWSRTGRKPSSVVKLDFNSTITNRHLNANDALHIGWKSSTLVISHCLRPRRNETIEILHKKRAKVCLERLFHRRGKVNQQIFRKRWLGRAFTGSSGLAIYANELSLRLRDLSERTARR